MKISYFILIITIVAVIMFPSCRTKRQLQKSNALYEAGEYFRAIEGFKKVYSGKKLKDKKLKAEISFKLGECYRNINLPKESARWYKRAIPTYQNPMTYLYYADALKMQDNFDEALIQYQEYQKLVPDDQRGTIGAESCEAIRNWMQNPTKYVVTEMKEWNSKQSDFCPTFAKDDYTVVYFTTTREEALGNKESGIWGQKFSDVFQTRKDRKNEWSVPTPLPNSINTEVDEGATAFDATYSTMYLTRCVKEKEGNFGCRIFISAKGESQWQAPTALDFIADSSISIGHPSLSKDELTLFFSATMENGLGGRDIWMVNRKSKKDKWGDPKNLGTDINTPGDEMYPYIHKDSVFYFSSNYHLGFGGLDIFRAEATNDEHWKIENMKSPINSTADDFGITLEEDEKNGFFSSSRPGGKGSDDIYQFSIPPVVFSISGFIKNQETDSVIVGASVKMIGSNGTSFELVTAKDGAYNFKLKPNTDYYLTTSAKNYFKGKAEETTKGLTESKEIKLDIYMKPIPFDSLTGKPTVIKLENIFYDYNQATLRPESQVALDSLTELLNFNPEIAIELMAHTDYVGTAQYNDTLSQRRAQSVVNYLIKKGIDPNRLVATGYGERKPAVVNDKIAKQYAYFKLGTVLTETYIRNTLQTDVQRDVATQLCRRTEFIVLTTEYKAGMILKPSENRDVIINEKQPGQN